jgi:sodium transport system permease protein
MALLLTTRPRQGLALRLPPAWSWPASALLAVLCVPPLAWLTLLILSQFPGLKHLLEEHNPLAGALQSNGGLSLNYLLVLAVLPALCEELAFRGFILTGLRRRFSPWTAVFLSSFLFALFQMNVFQFVPHFVLGAILALIALRTNSVAPSMVFHLVYNLCFIAPLVFPQVFAGLNTKENEIGLSSLLPGIVAAICAFLALGLLAAMLLSGKRIAADQAKRAAKQVELALTTLHNGQVDPCPNAAAPAGPSPDTSVTPPC